MIAQDCTPERRRELNVALLAYCGQDTLVLVQLVEWMEREASVT
jgi:hypothetical protein